MDIRRWARRAGIVVGLAVASCGGGSAYDIAMAPLSGKIGGQPWAVATAETDSFLSEANQIFMTMYADSFAACSGTSSAGNQLIISVPTQPGEYTLSLSMSATFYVAAGSQNLIATQGRVRVDTVTATAITGGLSAQFDGDNTVSGTFQATICP
jgi:hypothetical protein